MATSSIKDHNASGPQVETRPGKIKEKEDTTDKLL
jgi:hypothetical protein